MASKLTPKMAESERVMPEPFDETLMAFESAAAGASVARQLEEIGASLDVLASSIRDAWPSVMVTCARGSSENAAVFLKYVFETRCGLLVASLGPSVTSVFSTQPEMANGLCIAISQSGQSIDLLCVVRACSAAGVRTVAIVNDETSPVALAAQFIVPMFAGVERSVAATKSFIATLSAIVMLASRVAPEVIDAAEVAKLPALLNATSLLDWSPLADGLVDARGMYVVGRGPGLAIASEAALKLKETCGIQAEAFSSAEIRHGPLALLRDGFPVLVFRQNDAAADGVDDFARFAVDAGCQVFVAGTAIPGTIPLPTLPAHPLLEPLLQIQSFYGAANALSLRRGFNPDRPPHLQKITVTV